VLSHVAPDMAAEELAHPLPLGDPSRHFVETCLKNADFGAVVNGGANLVLPRADTSHSLGHFAQRIAY
jgi:hypothetical protein